MSTLSGWISPALATASGHTDETATPVWTCVGSPLAEADGLAVAIQGRPIWRTSEPQILQAGSDAYRLLEAYRQFGLNFLGLLHGAFALVVIDPAAHRAVLAVDRFGIERLAYSIGATGLNFANSAQIVARSAGASPRIRPQALLSYFFFHMIPSPETIFEGVRKLPPAHMLVLEPGRVTEKCYWQPEFIEEPRQSYEALRRELHAALEAAVRSDLAVESSGAFLSGGLDSSTVAGYLARVSDRQAKTFSIGFGVDDYDELHYARIANRHFGCQGHEFQVRPDDVVELFPVIARQFDEPFGNASALPTFCCARLAREHGVTHLLAGDGGDEIFAGNKRYAEQHIFERYQWLPRALRRGILEPALSGLPAALAVGPLRKARNYIVQANTPLPDRLESWNFLFRLGFATVLEPEFLGAVDPMCLLQHMRDVYTSIPSASVVNRMLYYDWRFTLADNDLRKVGMMCALAGVRASYPMLHPDVVDVSLRVPPNMKMPGTQLRKFYKRAVADFVPQEIIHKTKHGFGLPFGLWLERSARLTELVNANLASLGARGVIRPEFLDRLRQLHGHDDARYYGVLVWTLAMFEQWLQEHELAL